MDVLVSSIKEPEYAVRTVADDQALEDLKKSIKLNGLIQPIVVRREGKNYEIVAGHRRFMAHQQIGLEKIKVVVTKAKGLEAERIKIAENADREDVNAIDEGDYFAAIRAKYEITQKQLAEIMGRSEAYISQRLATAKWTTDIKDAVRCGAIPFTAGRALMTTKDIKERLFFFERVCQSGASPHVIMEWARQANDRLERTQQEHSNPTETYSDPNSYKSMIKCDCCGREGLLEESQMIDTCAYCKATSETEAFQIYMLECRQRWMERAAEHAEEEKKTEKVDGMDQYKMNLKEDTPQ